MGWSYQPYFLLVHSNDQRQSTTTKSMFPFSEPMWRVSKQGWNPTTEREPCLLHCFSHILALGKHCTWTHCEYHEHHGGPDLFETFEAAVDSENESEMDVDYAAENSDFDLSNAGDLDHAGSRGRDKLLTVTKLNTPSTEWSDESNPWHLLHPGRWPKFWWFSSEKFRL